jgi:hypothetical protein
VDDPSSVDREQPSLFRDVVERRETYRGPLEDARWNRHLVYRLGSQQPGEVVAVPMIVGGAVTVIFYGDTVPDLRPIGPLDTLEFMIAEAALAMERALVRRGRNRSTRNGRGSSARRPADCKFFLSLHFSLDSPHATAQEFGLPPSRRI